MTPARQHLISHGVVARGSEEYCSFDQDALLLGANLLWARVLKRPAQRVVPWPPWSQSPLGTRSAGDHGHRRARGQTQSTGSSPPRPHSRASHPNRQLLCNPRPWSPVNPTAPAGESPNLRRSFRPTTVPGVRAPACPGGQH